MLGGHDFGYTNGVIAVDTTFLPARSARDMWSMFCAASAAVGPKWASASAGTASAASMSVVASTPIGPIPAISPASRPCFPGSLTMQPTISKSGCATSSRITIFPTKPVPWTITL